MDQMELYPFKIIAAIDSKYGIGLNNKIPWKNNEDMNFFKESTNNSIIIMGKRTYQSINKKLKNRINIVISSNKIIDDVKEQPDYIFENLTQLFNNNISLVGNKTFSKICQESMIMLKNNSDLKKETPECWIIGGEMLYKEAICMKNCTEIILSNISGNYNCDRTFPNLEKRPEWEEYCNIRGTTILIKKYQRKKEIENDCDRQYNELVLNVLNKGETRQTRNSIVKSIFSPKCLKFDLMDGFPLITTRKISWNNIVNELIWFLNGDTDISYLKEKNVKIWDLNVQDFAKKGFARYENDAGLIYPYQWRSFGTRDDNIDQIEYLLNVIKNDPTSRRQIVTSYNPLDHVKHISRASLGPCHPFFQTYVNLSQKN